MLADIVKVLGPAISVAPVSASALPDLFEAYVLTLVIRAARDEGAGVRFLDRGGKATSVLILRTSPGYIYSQAKNYTHAVITFPGRPALEAHTGIKVAGKSGVLHELDVAVVAESEASSCRTHSVSPRSHHVLLGIECKYYTSALQLHLARGFIGLMSDLSVKSPYFVTNTSSVSVERLLSHRARHSWEKDITPSCKHTEVDRLVHAFRSIFKNYKAR